VGKQNYLKDGNFIAPHCDPDDRHQWDGLRFNFRALEYIPRIGPSPGRNWPKWRARRAVPSQKLAETIWLEMNLQEQGGALLFFLPNIHPGALR